MHALVAISFVSYLGAAFWQLRQSAQLAASRGPWLLGAVAALAHAAVVWMQMTTYEGVDIGLASMASLISLTWVCVVLVAALRLPASSLFLLLFPLAAVLVAGAALLSSDTAPRTDLAPPIVIHIVLSVLAFSVLTVAAMQGIVVALGDRLLKRRTPGSLLAMTMPPLETMESLMFGLLWLGVGLLTISMATGAWYMAGGIFAPGFIHHTVLSLGSWLAFAMLLVGRHLFGWRSRVAAAWTFAGWGLLLLAYFGTKVVLEIILDRV